MFVNVFVFVLVVVLVVVAAELELEDFEGVVELNTMTVSSLMMVELE